MGVVNITPDSFSDGGRFFAPEAAIAHALQLVEDGADILDLGAESTRPGAPPVPEDEELARLLPVLRALRDQALPVSVDTMKPGVMRAALDEGASMVNDVAALRAPGALAAIAGSGAAVCLMHMQGEPRTMQAAPHYVDVLAEVGAFLADRAREARGAGIAAESIVLDPGFGFGKNDTHNLALLRGLGTLAAAGYPVLAGLSRKSMLGRLIGRPGGSRPGEGQKQGDRLAASIAAALLAAQHGARILRVHDVAETRDALAIFNAVQALPATRDQPAS